MHTFEDYVDMVLVYGFYFRNIENSVSLALLVLLGSAGDLQFSVRFLVGEIL